jgi:phage-related protein
MFENIIRFIEQLIQNTINLINDLLAANAVVEPDDVVEAVTSLILALVEEIIDLLESILAALAPSVQAQIDVLIDGLRHSVKALIRIISAQESGINLGNVQEIVAFILEFSTNVFEDLINALEEIFNPNPPTPDF